LSFHWLRAAPRALVARRLWPVPVFVALEGLVPAIGCGPVTSEPGIASAGSDASVGAGSSSGEADATSSCHASAVLTYMQGNYQPAAAPSGACLGADGGGTWDDFYVSCLGPDKSQDQCSAYQQVPANAACAACILTPYTSSRLGPILDFGQFVGENIAGCIEIATPSDPSCPKAVQALTGCEIAACQANCPVDDPASLATRQQCAADADRAGCLSFFQMASACQATEADAGLAGPCASTGFKDFYDNAVPLFCGQTAVDAGVSIDAGLSNDASIGVLTDGGSPDAASDGGAD
jgi:hypothetical protein